MDNEKMIVRNSNLANLTVFKGLSAFELDIYHTITAEFTRQKQMKITLSFDEIRKKSGFSDKKYSRERFIHTLIGIDTKLASLVFHLRGDTKDIISSAFVFYVDREQETMTVELNKVFTNYFFNIVGGYTNYLLKYSTDIKSKYGKVLFPILLEHFSGHWQVSMKDFRNRLAFPPSYKNNTIIAKTEDAIKDMIKTGVFEKIDLKVVFDSKQGRPVKDLIFDYKINQERLLEMNGQETLKELKSENYKTSEILSGDISKPTDNEIGENGLPDIHKRIQNQEKKAVFDVCPFCGGKVIIKDRRNGKFALICENSKYFQGGGDCGYWKDCDKNGQELKK